MHQIGVASVQAPAPATVPQGTGVDYWWGWSAVALAWIAFVVAVGGVMKLFRRDSIVGPERMGPDETPGMMLGNLCLGVSAGMLSPILIRPMIAGLGEPDQKVILNAVVFVVGFIALLAASQLTRGREAIKVGLNPARLPIGIVGGLTALVLIDPAVQAVGLVVTQIYERLKLAEPVHPVLTFLSGKQHDWSFWTSTFTAWLLAPLAEELAFRGLLQTALCRFFAVAFDPKNPDSLIATRAGPRWAGVVGASLVFAGIHQSIAFFFPLFVLAVGFGYLYERTGNLWATITAHGLFNLTQTLLYLKQTGSH